MVSRAHILLRACPAAFDGMSSTLEISADGTEPDTGTRSVTSSGLGDTASDIRSENTVNCTETLEASESESASKPKDKVLVRNPGVRLCGRKVSKLFAVTTKTGLTYKKFQGVVHGSRPDATWGTVYSVKYADGDEQQLLYEELIPFLDEPAGGESAVPLEIVEASKIAKTDYMIYKHFAPERIGTRRTRYLIGVQNDSESPDVFYGVATDPETNNEHSFDVLFTTQFGAAAAHDLLVRRMLAVAITRAGKTYEELCQAEESFLATDEAETFLAKHLNFPNASWSEVCGIALGSVAGNLPPVPWKQPAPEPAAPEKKKKKRDAKTPHRAVILGHMYDSDLGVTCHWCRQKSLDLNVSCTVPSCAETVPHSSSKNGAPRVCGQCLKNRNGEDIFEAIESGQWVCPKCRGSCGPGCDTCCNCGPCRKANGMEPTGTAIAKAYAAGFSNVHDYLVGQATGEGTEAIARRKLDTPWRGFLRGNRESPSKTLAMTPPQSPRRMPPPMTPPTPLALNTLFPQGPSATFPSSGATSVVSDIRAALDDARAMLIEGIIDEDDYANIKATALASARPFRS